MCQIKLTCVISKQFLSASHITCIYLLSKHQESTHTILFYTLRFILFWSLLSVSWYLAFSSNRCVNDNTLLTSKDTTLRSVGYPNQSPVHKSVITTPNLLLYKTRTSIIMQKWYMWILSKQVSSGHLFITPLNRYLYVCYLSQEGMCSYRFYTLGRRALSLERERERERE